jgi:hypothetical protein
MPSLDDLNCQMFRDSLRSDFAVRAASGATIALRLLEVNEKQAPGLEQFSLTFRGPLAPMLEQRIHRLEHSVIGSRDLFVVPIGPDGEGMLYEVIFNRLRSSGK